MPQPVRSRTEPHGLKTNSRAQQDECDRGTIMTCRSITMAKEVGNRKKGGKIRAIATLENPPSSNVEGHCLTWELPEMRDFLEDPNVQTAQFDTCTYEPGVQVGRRHLKPQQFTRAMLGIRELEGSCTCGQNAQHEPVVGRERSRASGTCPDALCDKYARRAISHSHNSY